MLDIDKKKRKITLQNAIDRYVEKKKQESLLSGRRRSSRDMKNAANKKYGDEKKYPVTDGCIYITDDEMPADTDEEVADEAENNVVVEPKGGGIDEDVFLLVSAVSSPASSAASSVNNTPVKALRRGMLMLY